MNVFDILIGIPLLWAIFKGFKKGLILEIISIFALIAAIYGSVHFSFYIADIIDKKFHFKYSHITAFTLTFIFILIGLFWFAKVLETIVKSVALSLVNKILGSFFSLIKMAFIVSCFLYIINSINIKLSFISDKIQNDSLLYKPVSLIAPAIFPLMKEKFDEIKKATNEQLPSKPNK